MQNKIIVEALQNFTLKEFDKITIEKRKGMDTYGQINTGDTFFVDEEMLDYLSGNNKINKKVVKVVEIIPE